MVRQVYCPVDYWHIISPFNPLTHLISPYLFLPKSPQSLLSPSFGVSLNSLFQSVLLLHPNKCLTPLGRQQPRSDQKVLQVCFTMVGVTPGPCGWGCPESPPSPLFGFLYACVLVLLWATGGEWWLLQWACEPPGQGIWAPPAAIVSPCSFVGVHRSFYHTVEKTMRLYFDYL